MRLDQIVISDHDPGWANSFAQQRDRLTPLWALLLARPIEHIGSTSVPGLPAKPIIDMLAVVHDYDACAQAIADVAALGWLLAPEPGDEEQRKWSLCFPSIEHRTHHLHVVEAGSSGWPGWLRFRDYLRAHPAAAQEYASVKRELAAADSIDRVRYRQGKAPLIQRLNAEAVEWATRSRVADPTLDDHHWGG